MVVIELEGARGDDGDGRDERAEQQVDEQVALAVAEAGEDEQRGDAEAEREQAPAARCGITSCAITCAVSTPGASGTPITRTTPATMKHRPTRSRSAAAPSGRRGEDRVAEDADRADRRHDHAGAAARHEVAELAEDVEEHADPPEQPRERPLRLPRRVVPVVSTASAG